MKPVRLLERIAGAEFGLNLIVTY